MRHFILFAFAMAFLLSCGEKSNCELISSHENGLKKEERCPKEGNWIFTEYHESGNVYIQGELLQNELRNGIWISYYDNSQKWSQQIYVDGSREGDYMVWWPNGKIRIQGQYAKGQEVGKWFFYDELGVLVQSKDF
ncbi:MAG: toxin-antitoxin system YwqK family antitoxin [Flavobacteriales bacterium]